MQILKEIRPVLLNELSIDSSLRQIAGALGKLETHKIDHVSWPAYPYKPPVSFEMARGRDCIILHYFVNEANIRAVNTENNSSVWEDSCVELFISFNDQAGYYNFETNCIGAIRAAFGKERNHRELLPDGIINSIKRYSSIHRVPGSQMIAWELVTVFPLTVFIHDKISTLDGVVARGNFYKCGDKLPDPHFLCWNPIESRGPDFHLPAFFGRILF
jgi:hypothetical protein